MSDDGVQTTVIGAAIAAAFAALTAAVGWLVSRVLGNREDTLSHKSQIEALQSEVKALKDERLTRECVREEIEGALSKRDKVADERRVQWDELLTMRVQQAVSRGVQECHANTKAELELMVPRIVREVLSQTGRMRKPSADTTNGQGG